MVQDRAMLTMTDWWVVYDLSNSAFSGIFSDL